MTRLVDTVRPKGMPAPQRNLVTLKQAVEQRPWLTERFARRLIFERRIPFHKVGGKILVDLRDLDRFVELGRVEAVQ